MGKTVVKSNSGRKVVKMRNLRYLGQKPQGLSIAIKFWSQKILKKSLVKEKKRAGFISD